MILVVLDWSLIDLGLTFSKASNELVAVKLLATAEIPHLIKLFNLLRLLVHSAGFTCPYSQVVFFSSLSKNRNLVIQIHHISISVSKHTGGSNDFQIGVGCASMLIKYHQGLQHVDHFSYRHHPLTTLKLDDVIKGKMCLESIDDGPINGCAPCEF